MKFRPDRRSQGSDHLALWGQMLDKEVGVGKGGSGLGSEWAREESGQAKAEARGNHIHSAEAQRDLTEPGWLHPCLPLAGIWASSLASPSVSG